jgi:hypothetical protein
MPIKIKGCQLLKKLATLNHLKNFFIKSFAKADYATQ